MPQLIFLCGFMGSGKSTIGQLLATELGIDFQDLDLKIEENAGKSIPDIFKDSGETGFRRIERETLLQVIRNSEGVVALGGGSLQDQQLVDHIKLNGLLVFIETPISVILERICKDESRPLLLDKEGKLKSREKLKDELISLYKNRLPFYEQADIRLVNDGQQTAQNIAEQLLKKIKTHVSSY
ncbi:MAG TPA: shikimate kinase [Balneolaceae bacterium]